MPPTGFEPPAYESCALPLRQTVHTHYSASNTINNRLQTVSRKTPGSSLPPPAGLAMKDESAKLLEDKVRRAEAEARELEMHRQQAEREKERILSEAQKQKDENASTVSHVCNL